MKIITVRDIDKKIWRQFRSKCVAIGVNVGDQLNKLMEAFIKNQES